jgi:hypothetical protein
MDELWMWKTTTVICFLLNMICSGFARSMFTGGANPHSLCFSMAIKRYKTRIIVYKFINVYNPPHFRTDPFGTGHKPPGIPYLCETAGESTGTASKEVGLCLP